MSYVAFTLWPLLLSIESVAGFNQYLIDMPMKVTQDALKDTSLYPFESTRDRCDFLDDFVRLNIGLKLFGVKITQNLCAGVLFSSVGSIMASALHHVY